jgi:hypothetical protein
MSEVTEQNGIRLAPPPTLRCVVVVQRTPYYYAVGVQRQQVPTAENALKPAEKQLHGPAITVGQGDQLGGKVQTVGQQPEIR